jgi:His/Glu/Gln/Arg/opine family amino acid ABC transporter permease subunit
MLAVYDLWAFVSENWRELLDGLVNTIKVSLVAIAGSFVIGLVLGAARARRIPVVSQFTVAYVEIIRNTPILVKIFMIFFALPSSINTYISVVKNTSLMYVIGYPELTTTAINIANLTLETLEALTVIGIVYLALVWSLSAAIRVLEGRLALPEGR